MRRIHHQVGEEECKTKADAAPQKTNSRTGRNKVRSGSPCLKPNLAVKYCGTKRSAMSIATKKNGDIPTAESPPLMSIMDAASKTEATIAHGTCRRGRRTKIARLSGIIMNPIAVIVMPVVQNSGDDPLSSERPFGVGQTVPSAKGFRNP